MISYIYKKCLEVLRKKPIRLWGLSMLVVLLDFVAVIATFALPILWVPIILTLNAGMTLVFLDGYRGKEVNSDQVFAGFKKFSHVAGGMAWMALWILIWSLIPVAGIVISIIKAYSYRFTPYILLSQPEVSATQALRLSMEKTNGYKGTMFLADLIVLAIITCVSAVLSIFSMIPAIGVLFGAVAVIFSFLCSILLPLFMGLINAAFYDEVQKLPSRPKFDPAGQSGQTINCPNCGAPASDNGNFCASCGSKLK